ncbi:hypothetical protein [Rhodococcus sp. NPDC058639]|uniref:hypothetical protein n=1 Tax=Rhodococcus sp. NPDC058639 TaxID=3346570 RepID=UPI00364ED9E5
MPIDTYIDGDPAEISRVGDLIRHNLVAAVAALGDDVAAARRIADDAWDGEASDRYLREASRVVQAIDAMHAKVLTAADDFDQLSLALASALAEMSDLRERAAGAGLPVVCNTILDPGPQSEDALRMYDEIADAATDVHRRWARDIAEVTHRWTSPAWAALFTTTTGFDYLTAELRERVERLARRATMCLEHSARSMQAVLDLAPGTPYDEVRRLFGQAKASTDDLASTIAKRGDLAPIPTGLAVGPAPWAFLPVRESTTSPVSLSSRLWYRIRPGSQHPLPREPFWGRPCPERERSSVHSLEQRLAS